MKIRSGPATRVVAGFGAPRAYLRALSMSVAPIHKSKWMGVLVAALALLAWKPPPSHHEGGGLRFAAARYATAKPDARRRSGVSGLLLSSSRGTPGRRSTASCHVHSRSPKRGRRAPIGEIA